jgi:hypothetical protein
MKEKSWFKILGPLSQRPLKWFLIIALLLFFGAMIHTNVQGVDLNVIGVNKDGSETPVTEYRWLVEEDVTYHVIPGDPTTNWAVDFHRSYMPVADKGDTTLGTPPTGAILKLNTHYFVSVLPKQLGTYTIGGAPFVTDATGNASVDVYLNQLPLPTAQITVFVFQDDFPINNAPDTPQEQGLGGFSIILEDGGGRYGMSAGTQMLNAFGHPLGTVYQKDKQTGEFLFDADGMPIPEMNNKGVPLVEPLVTGACWDPDLCPGNDCPCPCENCGMLTIKNLAPGKYGVMAVPPVGTDWVQTSTIEGKKVIDVWVKANEPPFFAEFGPPGYHVAIGFTRPMNNISQDAGGKTIQGQVVNMHLSRPPDTAFYSGAPFTHTTPWVGLNLGATGEGRGVYAARTVDGHFTIPNVPAGDYQLVVWDDNMDLIFAFKRLSVTAGDGLLDLEEVPVFQWFTRLENWVFNDINEDGLWDPDEMGIPEQGVSLRWRDGTMYQSFPTDIEGFVPFDEIFPFFSWLVAEVDFARFKATGVTVVVDDGGPIPFGNPWSFDGQLNPQPQPDPDNPGFTLDYRVETGPVLTEAFQGFLGQTSVIIWGKKNYMSGENGGISGIVYYATTRAEDDPALAAAEPWEPGIPDVRVNLYDSTGEILINTTTTDNWDVSLPEDCPPGGNDPDGLDPFYQDGKCYDGMRNWNQVRPGIFDGGYAFVDYYPGGIQTDASGNPLLDPEGNPMPVVLGENPNLLVSGMAYVVEVVPPPGYEILRTQDRNVDFGDNYIPSRLRATCVSDFKPYPICCGEPYPVPAELSLFPGVTHPYYDPESPWYKGPEFDPVDNPFYLNDCDRKLVYLSDMENAAADFFLFTEVPVAGHIVGFILDDIANEFDPRSPQFGEKYAPPWLPVSVRDWTGREIARTYSDQYGRYNVLVPSTYTTNLPAPSGMSPNMLTTCMNDPILPDGSRDPQFNPQYSTFCYTFQYMPGATTYLDTPVVPVAAFAGPGQFPLDCEFPDGTSRIKQVDGENGGPYVPFGGTRTITIQSMGMTEVPNPNFCPSTDPYCVENAMVDDNPTIMRDYGFGGMSSQVTIGDTPLQVDSWNTDQITATVPANAATGQLTVTRGDNTSTIVGVTVTVGQENDKFNVVRVNAPSPPGVFPGAIQQAIDTAQDGDLILVAPGDYKEMVIMWKPLKLQGYGAGSTTISAFKTPPEKLVYWRQHAQTLISAGLVDLLPGQELAFGGIEPGTLFTEEGAGVFVIAKKNAFKEKDMARIDGFTITGADTGGGIVVNGYADFLQICNNHIENNSGFFGGGIRIGHPQLINEEVIPITYTDADNDFVRIHHNHIKENGGLGAAGGGVSLCTGSDSYEVSDNWICGNFTLGQGGGIGHTGLSDREKKDDPLPVIKNNTIIFNESFNQGSTVSGGGIFIGGGAPLTPGGLSPGSGSVKVIGNLIQGNSSGAGDGAGIRLSRVNGQDVENNQEAPEEWYSVDIFNNMIVNNVAALAGGGISMQDAVRSNIIHNTIANNDSTATAGEAFAPGSPNESTPQPAGMVSHANSPELTAALPDGEVGFSNPQLVDNIILHNRSFYFFGDPPTIPYGIRPDLADGDPPVYDDLAVLGIAEFLDPQYCFLTDRGEENPGPDYSATNIDEANDGADPAFVKAYFNGNRGTTIVQPEPTTIQAPAAFDEGGNFIRLRYGPLGICDDDTPGNGDPGLCSDYHINTGSDAINAGIDLTGTFPELSMDFDGESRPSGTGVDIGADEYMEPAIPALNTATTSLQARSSTIKQGSYAPLLSWTESYPLGSSLPKFSLTSDLSGQTLFRERSVYPTGLSQVNLAGFNAGFNRDAIGSIRLSLISNLSGGESFSGRPVYSTGLSQVNPAGFYPNTFDWQKLSLTSGFSWRTQFPGSLIYPAGFGGSDFLNSFPSFISSTRIYPGLQNLPSLREFF